MARNGSGTMSALSTVSNGTTIDAPTQNALISDICSEITNSLAKDGQTTMTGQIKAAAGTVAAPGIAFGSDVDSGLYRIGGDNLGLALAGAKVIDFGTGQIGFIDGTLAAPGIGFSSDTDTGFYRIGANNIGIAAGGTKIVDITASGANIVGALTKSGVAVECFASGTVMLFVQTSAPTGWTKGSTHNDKALRVVTGTASTGGSTAFSSVFASRTPAGTNSLSATIPINGYGTDPASNASGRLIAGNTGSLPGSIGVATTSPSLTISSNTFTGTAMDFAVQYVDVIIATKD